MSRPKTVRIKPASEEQGDFVVINEEDFNEEIHELFDEPENKPVTVPQMKKALKEAGVEFDPQGKKDDIEPLYLELLEAQEKQGE